ncbi:MAG: response regulator [Candidatus Omnitrophica bacterium]|nr:response regulator [Candidatus Omnitrophota bacterium]
MRNILVADDHSASRYLIAEILRGYATCEEATDGMDALLKYLEHGDSYDMLLLDIDMPKLDGLMVLKQIRLKEAFLEVPVPDRLPVIIMTGFPDRIQKGFEYGLSDYLVKPVSPDVLREKVQTFIKK